MCGLPQFLENNKDLWTRVYDEVITPNLETEWKKRNDQHEKELKSKDEEHQMLLARINNETIVAARLKEENARLKMLLQKQGNQEAASLEQLEDSTPDAVVSATEYRNIIEKFDELNKQYQSDAQKMKYLERKNAAVMQKNKEMKESVKAWQEYCDRNINKQKTKMKASEMSKKDHKKASTLTEEYEVRHKLPSSPGLADNTMPRLFVTQERSSSAPILSSSPNPYPMGTEVVPLEIENKEVSAALGVAEQGSSPTPDETTPTNARSAAVASSSAFLGQSNSVRLTSSQTTEDETAERNNMITQMETGYGDDIPMVVSERCLKRKRKLSPEVRIYTDRSDGTPAKPIRVKEELHSSPPPQTAAYELRRNDTIDLDEIPQNAVMTPHHIRVQRTFSIHSSITGNLRHQRSNSAPFNNNMIKTESNEDSAASISKLTAVMNAKTEGVRADRDPGEPMRASGDVLQPLDPNAVANRNEKTPNKRVRKIEMQEHEKHALLMESGETSPINEYRIRPPPSAARARYNERLRALKGAKTPSKPIVNTPKTGPARVRPKQVSSPLSTTNRQTHITPNQPHRPPEPRTEPTGDRRPIWTLAPLSDSTRKATALPAPKKHQGPLRLKPLEQLCIQDFKLNATYNQGYSFAFSETVRKQADRLCLPGCTSLQCCGSTFRALALASTPLDPLEEEELLQEHLGDAYDSYGLTQMNQDERKELVLQARTRQMAKQYGRHRQAFERGRSPPGFWRTGFPSTQELKADREKAKEIERELVRERWLEAMRRGGKWVFKDE